jgi:hypothetical protein
VGEVVEDQEREGADHLARILGEVDRIVRIGGEPREDALRRRGVGLRCVRGIERPEEAEDGRKVGALRPADAEVRQAFLGTAFPFTRGRFFPNEPRQILPFFDRLSPLPKVVPPVECGSTLESPADRPAA